MLFVLLSWFLVCGAFVNVVWLLRGLACLRENLFVTKTAKKSDDEIEPEIIADYESALQAAKAERANDTI